MVSIPFHGAMHELKRERSRSARRMGVPRDQVRSHTSQAVFVQIARRDLWYVAWLLPSCNHLTRQSAPSTLLALNLVAETVANLET